MKALRTSAKERVRLDAIHQVARSEVTVVAAAGASAAEALPIPRCRRAGASVACSPGNGRRAERPRERIVQRHQERYADLGPTLACEKLAEEGLTVSPDTLVALLRERHLWQRRRRRGRHGQRRERRASFGSLIQMDGAHHDRFEGRDPARVLRVPIDDAGGWTYARFYPAETTEAALDVFGGGICVEYTPPSCTPPPGSCRHPTAGKPAASLFTGLNLASR